MTISQHLTIIIFVIFLLDQYYIAQVQTNAYPQKGFGLNKGARIGEVLL